MWLQLLVISLRLITMFIYCFISLAFYTSRYGFKVCMRLYMYGDGVGKGTHMSLFFVIMKGEYDPLLSWPFKHKVWMNMLPICYSLYINSCFINNILWTCLMKINESNFLAWFCCSVCVAVSFAVVSKWVGVGLWSNYQKYKTLINKIKLAWLGISFLSYIPLHVFV